MSNKRSGYIQNLTLKRKKKTVGTTFRSQLQDSPTSSQNVLEFGERSREVFHEYAVSKSPIKVNLFKNGKYNSLIYDEKSTCTPASNKNVPFTIMDLEDDPFDQSSMMSIVKYLNNASLDNKKYFTVTGKIFLIPETK